MSDPNEQLSIATLAAAIVTTRQKTDPKALKEAWEDARWTIKHRAPAHPDYKAWQRRHGQTPTSSEEDEQAKKKSEENAGQLGRQMAGWMAR